MKAFVTGSTGLLGSNLVYALIEAGWEVKALVRSKEKAKKQFGNLKIEFVQGDMENIPAFAQEMKDCDVLFHTAAYFREYFGLGEHWEKLERINVRGTIKLLTTAEAQGVKKTIYVSSSGVIGKNPDASISDENSIPDKPAMQNLYFRSKVLAEEKIAEWLKNHQMPVVLILPTAIFGPRDAAPTASGRIVIDAIHGKLPAIPPGGFRVIDARDVAKAMIAAVEKGKRGERYIISNRYASVDEILTIISKLSSRPKPFLKLNYAVAMLFAQVSELFGRITGIEPQVTVGAIQTLGNPVQVSSAKAQAELGLEVRPFEETLHDALEWFMDNGYINQDMRIELKAIQA